MTRQQQGVLGAGDRDVQQPALLVDAALFEAAPVIGDLVGQPLSIVDVCGVEHRDTVLGDGGAVTAQQRRQISSVGEPGSCRRRRREHPPAQVWHRDHLPLQPLRGVHGQDLYPVTGDGHFGGRKAVLHLLGSIQIPQQARHRRALAGGEVGNHVGERIEVLGARPAR
jgi:hypothetical protein